MCSVTILEQVDTLHINSAHFQLRHMDSVTAFGALKVLRIERLAFVGAHMDDAAFALLGRLTHLEELALNVVLGGITDEGFLAGLESLRSLRYLELFSVRQVESRCACLSHEKLPLKAASRHRGGRSSSRSVRYHFLTLGMSWDAHWDWAAWAMSGHRTVIVFGRPTLPMWLGLLLRHNAAPVSQAQRWSRLVQMSDTALEVLCANWAHLGSLRLASCERLTDRALLAMSGLPALYHLFLSGNQSFSHGLMSALKQRIKLATFRQCGDLSVCIYGSLPPAGG